METDISALLSQLGVPEHQDNDWHRPKIVRTLDAGLTLPLAAALLSELGLSDQLDGERAIRETTAAAYDLSRKWDDANKAAAEDAADVVRAELRATGTDEDEIWDRGQNEFYHLRQTGRVRNDPGSVACGAVLDRLSDPDSTIAELFRAIWCAFTWQPR